MFYYMRYSAIERERALFLWAGTVLATGVWLFLYLSRSNDWGVRDVDSAQTMLAAVLCVLIAVPFVVRLWSKWVQGNLTDAERLPGTEGWRTWLSSGNIIPALLIAVLAWKGFQLPLPLMLFTTLGALAVYPAIRSVSEGMDATSETPHPVADHMAHEREKVLSMLESGKITAEESAELLTALGATLRRPEAAPLAMTSAQRLVLIGAGVLLIGFFLPWLVINPADEVNRMMQQVTSTAYSTNDFPNIPAMMGQNSMQLPGKMQLPIKMEFQIAGGSLGKGLGWAALGLGLLAALLPYASRAMDFQTQRLMRFLALGAGATILLHVFSEAPRSIGIGLIVAALGIALEFIGVARERRIA